MISRGLFVRFSMLLFVCSVVKSGDSASISDEIKSPEMSTTGRQLIEQGRTLVHHTVKRLMIILPAIFFKLGIAFTLLILVALAVVNNGFIGFLILVVGLSTVLSRLGGQSGHINPVAVPYVSPPVPLHYHQAQVWDRNDNVNYPNDNTNAQSLSAKSQAYYPQLTNYYAKYASPSRS